MLSRGSKGPDVVKVQKALQRVDPRLAADGDFGPATEAAVKAYQKRSPGLDDDGIVGPETWGKLFPGTPMPADKHPVGAHPELKPGIAAVMREVLQRYPQLRVTATTGGGHATHSFHYQGRAVDLATSNYGEMDEIGRWIANNLTAKLAEGIHNPTLSVRNRARASQTIWGAETWANHRNHIHLAV
jgi:hypothetical protein